MERFLNPFKARAVYRLVRYIEKSFVRNIEATERCLLQNKARHGCVSLYQQTAGLGDAPSCDPRGAGKRITERTTTSVRGLSRDRAATLLRVIMATLGYQTVGIDTVSLNHAVMKVHTGATVNGLKFDSRQTPNRTGNSRSYQNSFCRVAVRGLASTQLGPDGLVQTYPRQRIRKPDTDSIIRGSVYVHVECYVHVSIPVADAGPRPVHAPVHSAQLGRDRADPEQGPAPERADDIVFAVVQVLRNAKAVVFSGIQTVLTQEPAPVGTLHFEDMYLVPLAAFQAQLLMLTAAGDVQILRFIECPGKLDQL